MKTAFIIFSTNAIKIHKFSSSLICHMLDSERAASSMLHDFHKAHHPSDECSHFGERLHDSPEHCLCLSLGLQAPPRRILCRRQTSCGHQRQPGAAGCGCPCPMQPFIIPPHAPSRPQDTTCPPPRHRSTVGTEPPCAGLLFSPLASQFHLNRIASASTNDAHKLTMLNVSNLTSHFLVNSVKFLCFITDSYSRRACVK